MCKSYDKQTGICKALDEHCFFQQAYRNAVRSGKDCRYVRDRFDGTLKKPVNASNPEPEGDGLQDDDYYDWKSKQ